MDLATILLSVFMVGSTIADVETTIPNTIEYNPIMRSFKDSRPTMYTIKGSMDLGVAIISHKLRHSSRKRDRIIGWALPVFAIVVQSAAAAHNARH